MAINFATYSFRKVFFSLCSCRDLGVRKRAMWILWGFCMGDDTIYRLPVAEVLSQYSFGRNKNITSWWFYYENYLYFKLAFSRVSLVWSLTNYSLNILLYLYIKSLVEIYKILLIPSYLEYVRSIGLKMIPNTVPLTMALIYPMHSILIIGYICQKSKFFLSLSINERN